MADSPSNSQPSLDRDDRIRVFLERAESILLLDSSLSEKCQNQLLAIAREAGLSSHEYADVLQDLQDRQIIAPKEIVFIDEGASSAGIEFVDEKEKLPQRSTRPGASDERLRDYLLRARGIIIQNEGINERSRKALFELSERMGLTESQVHAAIVSLRDTIQSAQTRKPPEPETASRGVPPPLPPAQSSAPPQAAVKPLDAFLDRAETILVEHGGFNPRSQMLLAAAAKEAGISDDRYRAALDKLRTRFSGEQTVPAARKKWSDGKVEEPSGPPAATQEAENRPQVLPAEAFGKWLSSELAARAGERLTRGMYKAWIRHAEHEFRMDRVYARHLIDDEIILRGFVVSKNDQDEIDPRVTQFLEQAAPILAKHRGINAKSRVLLNAVAQQCGLSVAEMDQAIGASETENLEEKRLKERIASFTQSLTGALQQLDNSLLNARLEQKLVEQGELKFGLPAAKAKAIVLDAAGKVGVQRITHSQAEEHVLTLLDEHIGRKLYVPNDVRQRMMAEGAQWGLKPEQVDSLVAEAIQENRRGHRIRKRVITILVALILLTATGIGAVLLQESVNPTDDSGSAANASDDGTDARKKSVSNAKNLREARKWWSKSMHIAFANAWQKMEKMRSTLRSMDAERAADRGAAYRKLVRFAVRADEQQAKILRVIVAGCYALDPAEVAAKSIAEELAQTIPDFKDKSSVRIGVAVWATRTAAVAVGYKGISGQRAQLLSDWFSRSLGRTMSSSGKESERELKWVAALVTLLYDKLAPMAESNPTFVVKQLLVLRPIAKQFVDPATRVASQARVVSGLLLNVGNSWQAITPTLKAIVNDSNPQTVLRLLEKFEQLPDSPLRDHLGSLFIEMLGAMPNVSDLAEIGPLVRKKLGISSLPSTRWSLFQDKVNEQLARQKPQASRVEQLQDIVNLTQLSVMGAALSLGDQASKDFEKLGDEEPLKIVEDRGTTSRRDPLAIRNNRTLVVVHNNIKRLRSSKNRLGPLRQMLAVLATQARTVPDVDGKHAAMLADFLLSNKSKGAHDAVMQNIEPIAMWPSVRAAVADQLKTRPQLDDAMLEKLLSKLLPKHEIRVKDDEGWRLSIRAALTESVLAQFGSAVSSRNGRMYDRAQEAILELHRLQAKLFQLNSQQANNAATSAELLRLFIEKMANQASSGSLSSKDRAWVTDLPHRVAAIDYLAANDLQENVMLQRVWLRLLRTLIVQKSRSKRSDADDIVEKLNVKDRSAKDALLQMREGQMAIVKMWVLWNERAKR